MKLQQSKKSSTNGEKVIEKLRKDISDEKKHQDLSDLSNVVWSCDSWQDSHR